MKIVYSVRENLGLISMIKNVKELILEHKIEKETKYF